MTTGLSVRGIVTNIGASGGSLWYSSAILMDYKFNLRAIVCSFGLLHNRSGEGEKIVTRRFDLQSGGERTIEIKSSRIEIGKIPFYCLGGIGNCGIVVR